LQAVRSATLTNSPGLVRDSAARARGENEVFRCSPQKKQKRAVAEQRAGRVPMARKEEGSRSEPEEEPEGEGERGSREEEEAVVVDFLKGGGGRGWERE